MIEQAPDHPKGVPVPSGAMRLRLLLASREAKELFQYSRLPAQVQEHCEPIEEALREERLLMPVEARQAVRRVGLVGGLVIVALGGYKLLVALAKGRTNVGFLLVFAAVGLVALILTCRLPRLTQRGRDYLDRLRDAFEGLKPRHRRRHDGRARSGPAPGPGGLRRRGAGRHALRLRPGPVPEVGRGGDVRRRLRRGLRGRLRRRVRRRLRRRVRRVRRVWRVSRAGGPRRWSLPCRRSAWAWASASRSAPTCS